MEASPQPVAASVAQIGPGADQWAAGTTADAALDPDPSTLAHAIERGRGRAAAQLVFGIAAELVEAARFAYFLMGQLRRKLENRSFPTTSNNPRTGLFLST